MRDPPHAPPYDGGEWIGLREVRGKKGPVETPYSAELAFVRRVKAGWLYRRRRGGQLGPFY